MKTFAYIFLFAISMLFSCEAKKEKLKAGTITFAMDYPDLKDRFFTYSIMPKEMILEFDNGKMKGTINKLGTENIFWTDCNLKSFSSYFNVGEDKLFSSLKQEEIQMLKKDNEGFQISLTNETDTLCGFNIKKALAKNSAKNLSFDIWYTEEIAIPNAQWFTPYDKVPGVILKYSMLRFGMKTEVKAVKITGIAPEKDFFKMNKNIQSTDYSIFKAKIDSITSQFLAE